MRGVEHMRRLTAFIIPAKMLKKLIALKVFELITFKPATIIV